MEVAETLSDLVERGPWAGRGGVTGNQSIATVGVYSFKHFLR